MRSTMVKKRALDSRSLQRSCFFPLSAGSGKNPNELIRRWFALAHPSMGELLSGADPRPRNVSAIT